MVLIFTSGQMWIKGVTFRIEKLKMDLKYRQQSLQYSVELSYRLFPTHNIIQHDLSTHRP